MNATELTLNETNMNNAAIQAINVGDVVPIEIMREDDFGKYVRLTTYNLSGCIISSEIHSRRNPNQKELRKYSVGKQHMAKIIRLDREKGYIDLSIRRVL
jgi:translation initiation factor 2 subunit 1